MDRKFLEKLIILIVLFIGVTIGTSYIVGNYVNQKKAEEQKKNTSLILENINLF